MYYGGHCGHKSKKQPSEDTGGCAKLLSCCSHLHKWIVIDILIRMSDASVSVGRMWTYPDVGCERIRVSDVDVSATRINRVIR